ncbi:NAD(P)H-dependent oxidoreductase [Candidatus Berkiella cookevillensis]|uniref:NAD(P)H-dependent oxidoreductase n=1 Tax=Candidatus Berkiella cookevillensis TaxID=437022 RepID=A0A0Q9YCR8_9GAMM|nr:NADPH-dependent FMN reductase [Candidatus Berkiella cookevillensis]MCS5708104.1 NAD(P)H-dependent oxidoreductase [Candidatus Berkiella cookevillensis]
MTQYQIAVIVGSIRRDSFNAQLAKALAKLAPANFSFKQLKIDDLPLYNQDNDNNPPESVKRLKSEIASANGLLFCTPEYNRSIPGVLKNAIDHASRPYGQSAWAKKPASVIGISVGAVGTALAQQHLRNILSYLDVPTLNQPEVFLQIKDGFFDANGNIGEGSKEFLQSWMDLFVDWIKKHNS